MVYMQMKQSTVARRQGISQRIYLNNILMMLIISPYRLGVITGLWQTAYNNVASDVQSEGDGLKYPYKDEEHAEKKYFIEPFSFFFFCSH